MTFITFQNKFKNHLDNIFGPLKQTNTLNWPNIFLHEYGLQWKWPPRVWSKRSPWKYILLFHSLLVASQRYTLVGKNKIREFKKYVYVEAQIVAYNISSSYILIHLVCQSVTGLGKGRARHGLGMGMGGNWARTGHGHGHGRDWAWSRAGLGTDSARTGHRLGTGGLCPNASGTH